MLQNNYELNVNYMNNLLYSVLHDNYPLVHIVVVYLNSEGDICHQGNFFRHIDLPPSQHRI